MFGIGSTELLVIIIVALVVLGPKSIPQIAKTVGKVVGEFRRVSTDFQRTLNAEVAREEHEENKKVAEKELFGDSVAQPVAPIAQTAPQVDATSTPPQAPETKPTAEIAVAEVATETHITTPPIPDIPPNSPLARAVAKTASEATDKAATPSAVEIQAPDTITIATSKATGTIA